MTIMNQLTLSEREMMIDAIQNHFGDSEIHDIVSNDQDLDKIVRDFEFSPLLPTQLCKKVEYLIKPVKMELTNEEFQMVLEAIGDHYDVRSRNGWEDETHNPYLAEINQLAEKIESFGK